MLKSDQKQQQFLNQEHALYNCKSDTVNNCFNTCFLWDKYDSIASTVSPNCSNKLIYDLIYSSSVFDSVGDFNKLSTIS